MCFAGGTLQAYHGRPAKRVNVTCDKCNKRYSIADDKVRGKSVKIRCKQCQNLISVSGPGAPAASTLAAPAGGMSLGAAATGSFSMGAAASSKSPWDDDQSTRAMPALDTQASWYAMVRGSQLGPMTLKEMEAKVKAGDVTLRTYLWKQGMGDWKRASDVPEVSLVFAGVSVAAAATGPVTAATQTSPERPATKAPRAIQKDVAVANEMPSPELTLRPAARPTSTGQIRAQTATQIAATVAPAPAASRTAAASGATATQVVAPVSQRTDTQREDLELGLGPEPATQAAGAPLNDLFADADLPSNSHAKLPLDLGNTQDDSVTGESPSQANKDPFAALGAGTAEAPPPGESTAFFIAQAGVNKRNPPWKIALFVLALFGLPVSALYLLSTLHIVPLEVKRTDENGREVTQSFFSADGVAGLKDLLTGEEARRREAAAAKKKAVQARADQERRAAAVAMAGASGGPVGDPTGMPTRKEGEKAKFTDEEMKRLYGVGGNTTGNSPFDLGSLKTDAKVKAKPVFDEKPVVSEGSGLSAKAVSDTVAKSQNAFQSCIEQALRKTPNMRVGKVTLVVEVGASGAVKSSGFEQKVHEMSDWGTCLKERARRMVFPQSDSDEETRVEIPLVVGVSMQ